MAQARGPSLLNPMATAVLARRDQKMSFAEHMSRLSYKQRL
jgi:hypothetical protein